MLFFLVSFRLRDSFYPKLYETYGYRLILGLWVQTTDLSEMIFKYLNNIFHHRVISMTNLFFLWVFSKGNQLLNLLETGLSN